MPAVIVNPRAAAGAAGHRWREAAAAVESRLGGIECRYTKGAGDAIRIARELAEAGCGTIVAAGGDGTLNEVVNGVLASGQPVRIGLLPLATGGDFARTLGLRGIAHAIEVLAAGEVRRFDAMLARYAGRSGCEERYFVNAASIGLGAEVAGAVRDGGGIAGGRARYLAAAARRVAAGRAYELSLQAGTGAAVELRVTTVAIANGRYQGGGMLLAPLARPGDGLIDVTVVEEVGLATLVRHVVKLYSGAIYSHPKVRHLRAARLRAAARGAVPFECDGEPLGTLPVDVEAVPGAWQVLAP